MKRFIICCFILGVLFSVGVSADTLTTEEFLREQGEIAGTDKLGEALPEDIKDYLDDKGISPSADNSNNGITVGGAFEDIIKAVTERAKAPIACAASVLAVILISSALNIHENSSAAKTSYFAVTAVTAVIIGTPVLRVISTCVETMQAVAVFMTAFVPVFVGIIAANGQTATSVEVGGLLLGATQVVDLVATHFVIPLMCGYLCVSIVSGVSPLLQKTTLSEALKKVAFWVMSLVTTVFLGVLSIQTTITASGDTLTMRTARFVIGSSVPVAGTVLSEALTTVTASLGILKTSVAIYGVVACCAIFLPLILELLVWRVVLNITAAISGMLSSQGVEKLLKSADGCISVLCGIIMLTAALFVISLTVVVSVGKTV